VLSSVRMVRHVVPSMKSRGGGAIVIATSSAVKEPIPNLALSNVVRSSVSALSKTLSNELAADGIRVNHLLPGRINTDRIRELDTIRGKATGSSPEDVRVAYSRNIPLGRYGEPDEFASAALFLFSNAARYITGASLQVDGGLVRSVF
jgi:3-oxoacyl-[acyl-carrier protein] reductase